MNELCIFWVWHVPTLQRLLQLMSVNCHLSPVAQWVECLLFESQVGPLFLYSSEHVSIRHSGSYSDISFIFHSIEWHSAVWGEVFIFFLCSSMLWLAQQINSSLIKRNETSFICTVHMSHNQAKLHNINLYCIFPVKTTGVVYIILYVGGITFLQHW